MMRNLKITLICLLSLIFAFSMFGCDNNSGNEGNQIDETTAASTDHILAITPSMFGEVQDAALLSDVMQILPDMKLQDVVNLIGAPHRDVHSVVYPFGFEWDIEDGSVLYMVFEGEDYDSFIKKWNNREFVNPGEALVNEDGMKIVSESEMQALKGWCLNTKCVSATIKNNGENTDIFAETK